MPHRCLNIRTYISINQHEDAVDVIEAFFSRNYGRNGSGYQIS